MERTPQKQPQGGLAGAPRSEQRVQTVAPSHDLIPVAAALARALHAIKVTSTAPSLHVTLAPGLPPARIDPEHLHQILLRLLTITRPSGAQTQLSLRIGLTTDPRLLTLTLTVPTSATEVDHSLPTQPTFIAQLALIDRLARPHGAHLQLVPRGPELHLQLTLPVAPSRPLRVIERPPPAA